MGSNGNYPPGATYDPAAPWNERVITKEVTIKVTYIKTIKIDIAEGYSQEDLEDFVKDTIILPDNFNSFNKVVPWDIESYIITE